MDNCGGTQLVYQCIDTPTVSNVELVMNEPSQFLHQPLLVEAGVALRPEDHRSLIVVDAVNFEAVPVEVHTGLRADET